MDKPQAGLADTVSGLEAQRRGIAGRVGWAGAGVAAAAVLAWSATGEVGAFGLVALLGGGGLWAYGASAMSSVKSEFRRVVLPAMVAQIAPGLAYRNGQSIPETQFNACGLFMRPDRYSASHLVEGRLGDTAVHFGMVHAEERYEERDSDGKTEVKYRTIFGGLFFVADFNKHFAGKTLVKPSAANFLDKLFGSIVRLEDPEFNEQFHVSTNDQVEARYIMTPALMERFKSLRQKMGPLHASFSGGNMTLAIPMQFDTFEVKMFTPITEDGSLGSMKAALDAAAGIVDDLGLNTRIWSKAPLPA